MVQRSQSRTSPIVKLGDQLRDLPHLISEMVCCSTELVGVCQHCTQTCRDVNLNMEHESMHDRSKQTLHFKQINEHMENYNFEPTITYMRIKEERRKKKE